MVGKIIICGLLFSLSAAGQELETIDSIPPQENSPTLMGRLHQVQQYLDHKAKSKVDPSYIEVPDKPWRIILRYKENGVDVDYEHSADFPATNERVEWKLCFEPPIASSVGFWVGYRGTGFSYSKSLTKNAGRYYSFSTTGAKYGFNFRLRRFKTEDANFSAVGYKDGQIDGEPYDTAFSMPSPVWIRSVYVNGYYVFNGRRYSQAAAYNQSVIQRHSAGSFLLGATWYQSSFDYSDWANGKPDKPLTMLKKGDDNIYYWDEDSETSYSALHLNLDLRLGIAYNWSNYFIGLQAQYNNFIYKKDQSKVNIYDAYARIALGVRL